jgi:hypothetical protein
MGLSPEITAGPAQPAIDHSIRVIGHKLAEGCVGQLVFAYCWSRFPFAPGILEEQSSKTDARKSTQAKFRGQVKGLAAQ